MPDFLPNGYVAVRDALDRIGRDIFLSDWDGDTEYRARRGLLSEEEWRRVRDLAMPRGSGAPGSRGIGWTGAKRPTAGPHATGDPAAPSYRAEYRARKRYEAARDRLRTLLEAGELEAAVLDPWTGTLHEVPPSFWRRFDTDRAIEAARAAAPGSSIIGPLLIKQFGESARPLPQAKINQVIEALKRQLQKESLTRPEQIEFVRRTFPDYRVTDRQFRDIFRAIPVSMGRPKKSGNSG